MGEGHKCFNSSHILNTAFERRFDGLKSSTVSSSAKPESTSGPVAGCLRGGETVFVSEVFFQQRKLLRELEEKHKLAHFCSSRSNLDGCGARGREARGGG